MKEAQRITLPLGPGHWTGLFLLIGGLILTLCLGVTLTQAWAKNPNPATQANLNTARKLPHIKVMLNGETFDLEVAVTLEDQLKGLMFRETLAEKKGMIFTFDPPRAVNFWMKNCKIPLDMIFIRQGVVAHVVQSAAPCLRDPCPVYPSVYSIDTVIELPAGSAKTYSIQSGDHVQLMPPHTAQSNAQELLEAESHNASDALAPLAAPVPPQTQDAEKPIESADPELPAQQIKRSHSTRIEPIPTP